MSHFTKIRTRLVDEETLKGALAGMGYDVSPAESGVKGWLGGKTPADFKISPGSGEYDIGFTRENGAYTIVADWWGIRSATQEKFAAAVTQQYGVVGALRTLEDQGFELGEQVRDRDGTVRLTLRRTR